MDPAGIEERVSGLCLLPLECLLSSDVTVRKELLRLVDIVLTCLSKGAIMTFGSNLCAYATAALNSLEKVRYEPVAWPPISCLLYLIIDTSQGIQIDGVSFLNLLLRTFPQILVPHAESLISVLTRLMEVMICIMYFVFMSFIAHRPIDSLFIIFLSRNSIWDALR